MLKVYKHNNKWWTVPYYIPTKSIKESKTQLARKHPWKSQSYLAQVLQTKNKILLWNKINSWIWVRIIACIQINLKVWSKIINKQVFIQSQIDSKRCNSTPIIVECNQIVFTIWFCNMELKGYKWIILIGTNYIHLKATLKIIILKATLHITRKSYLQDKINLRNQLMSTVVPQKTQLFHLRAN